MIKPQCNQCKFWKEVYPEQGQCRAHVPLLLGNAMGHVSGWPVVHATDWCGEFQAQPTSPPAAGELKSGFHQNMP